MKKALIFLAVALLGGAAMAQQQYDTLCGPDGLNVPGDAVCDYSMMLSAPSLRQEEAPAIQTVNLSCAQYDCNPKPWAIGLAAVSGTSFTIGTCNVIYAFWYYHHPRRRNYDVYNDGPVDLTVPACLIVGGLYYIVSIGTGIPSIILFKKAGRNAQSAAPLACDNRQLFPNGVQCELGVQPGGFGINIDF